MDVSRHFSATYREARRKFLDAGGTAGCKMESFEYPLPGPGGERLFTDVARYGPADAEKLLVTISATHGVEGFCGSALQTGWLEERLHRQMPEGVALMHVHAINPYGFAWLRRVTHENVDLNRNFIERFAQPPANEDYETLHPILCPEEWNDSVIAETQGRLRAYARAHGRYRIQRAIAGGQYRHPDGLFYGGGAPTWSNVVLERIFGTIRARRAAVIDYHSGLGPRGKGERICIHPVDSGNFRLADRWYNGDIASPALGNSVTVAKPGASLAGMQKAARHTEIVMIALEFGTLPAGDVTLALRADNWLHHHGEVDSSKGRAIKRQIRDAFYCDEVAWKQSIWERALATQRLAVEGLAAGE
ncbi:MAG TPA: M14 family metallopeptidase [Stellaceae bacterium]|nr:M14 family metallopeptidase [Stellaceae bacterium]